MSLQFIMGRSGAGKTTWMLDDIRTKLRQQPARTPIIYIVPEQMTFTSEHKLAATPGLQGTISAQVYSFTRLAWRVLQETGGMSRTHITSAGVDMMITKVIEEKKDELKLFYRSAGKPGFVSNLEKMIIELKRYCIAPEQMEESFAERLNENEDQNLKDKLHDLGIVYGALEKLLAEKYIDSEDYLSLLAEKIPQSSYLKDAEIYIDGFYSLTPQELLVVNQLLRTCKHVKVSLTLDKPFRQGFPQDFYLFATSARLYHTVYQLAQQASVGVEEDLLLQGTERFTESMSLAHLETNFNIRPVRAYQGTPDAEILMAANRRAEVEGIAREILQLVRTGRCRWHDIAVLVRNGEAYHDLIRTIFQDYQIPLFIDAKQTMLHHPLIELMRSALETIQTNWRYEPVFRTIKTELLFPEEADHSQMRIQVDRLENYVLSRGIKGERWTSDELWVYRRFRGLELEDRGQTDQELAMQKEINAMKKLVAEPLGKLERRCKRAKTGLDFCRAIYVFLEELKVPVKLEKLRADAEAKGHLHVSRHHEQAWKAVVGLLDQFVEAMGDMPLSLRHFSSVLDTGLQALCFSQVPPAIDQVLVANMDLSRLNDIKVGFVIGLNEGVLPMKPVDSGILSDEDRIALHKAGVEVAPDSVTKLFDEEFTAYRAFTTPSHKLYLSYPLGDEEGGALLPSPYIKRVQEVLPDMKVRMLHNEPNEDPEHEQLLYITNEDMSLSYLTSVLQVKKRGYEISPVWYSLYNYFLASEQKADKMQRVLSSLFYENNARRLTKETAKQLYGKKIVGSVSRMERFNSCQFAHFASHGLRLKERKVYRLEAPDIGEMFHGALKIISDTLIQRNILWSSLTKEDCRKYANMAVNDLAPKLQNQILQSSNRHFYIQRKLENVIGRASMVLSEQARHSGFEPYKLELGFGLGGKDQLPPLRFTLPDGTNMELVGRVDRIDRAFHNEELYVRIVDYKSSEKDLKLDEVYYGLALQMLTYLDVVISYAEKLMGKQALPAGMLYFHVHNPFIKASEMLSDEKIEDAIFKQFKMNGLLLDNQEILHLMDSDLKVGEKSESKIIPASILKSGGLSKSAKTATKEDFDALRQFVHRSYQGSGSEIIDGETNINPYKMKDRTPCTFCEFRSVCQFDKGLEENGYRLLKPMKPEEVLNAIKGEGEGQ
ncbi:MAG: helicase-exonuclease AddAB subunit AddB [Bacillus sp. (in: firmicutes)]